MKIQTISDDAKYALAVGRENHYWFRVLGTMGVIPQPVYKDEWWYLPYEPDINIPEKALKRAEILKSEIPIKQMIVAHEAPLLLCAPAPKKKELPEIGSVVGIAFKTAGVVLLAMFSLVGLFFTSAVAVDPALIVVLEDGTWVEVMRWYE
jgi:hypothetical protein